MVVYIVQKARIKSGEVKLNGNICLSIDNINKTECGKELTDQWYILNHGGEGLYEQVTCQKCKDLIGKKDT